MRLAEQHHGSSRLMQVVMPAWAVKSRRAPPRRCKGAEVCGHTISPPCMTRHERIPSIPRRIETSGVLNLSVDRSS